MCTTSSDFRNPKNNYLNLAVLAKAMVHACETGNKNLIFYLQAKLAEHVSPEKAKDKLRIVSRCIETKDNSLEAIEKYKNQILDGIPATGHLSSFVDEVLCK